jgi:flagellar FliL protein
VAEEVEGLEIDGGAKASAAAGARKKKMVLIGAAAALLFGGGGTGAWYMMSGSAKAEGAGAEHGSESAHAEAEQGGKPTYVEVPPMVINLRSADGQQRFLKLRFVLVPAEAADKEEIQNRLPVILDSFQPFLRELRPEDLSGSAAVFRLKEELLIRAGEAFGRGRIRDILIQDLIQQ